MGECFFWYGPTELDPDKGPLNSCMCVCFILHSCVFIAGLTLTVLQDAIAQNSFQEYPPYSCRILRGDTAAAFVSCDHVVTAELCIGGQEHFYLETHGVRVVPTQEDGEIIVHSGIQDATRIQVSTVNHKCI